MNTGWSYRHAPELAEPEEGGNVWLLTLDGRDVEGSALYGEGFTRRVAEDLNDWDWDTDDIG